MSNPAESQTAAGLKRSEHGGKDVAPHARDDETSSSDAPEALREAALAALPEVCALIRRKTGHDFSRYKQSTLARRVVRRVSVLHLNDIEEYIARLQHDLKEVEALFNDLLIGVTQFFRDP